jgi:hypothetical protein
MKLQEHRLARMAGQAAKVVFCMFLSGAALAHLNIPADGLSAKRFRVLILAILAGPVEGQYSVDKAVRLLPREAKSRFAQGRSAWQGWSCSRPPDYPGHTRLSYNLSAVGFPHTRRILAALLMALALPHADAGGLIICVNSDGSRNYEFACGCGAEANHEYGACACDCGGCAEAPVQPRLREAPCVCTDFQIAAISSAGQSTAPGPRVVSVDLNPLPAQPMIAVASYCSHRIPLAHFSGDPPGRAGQNIAILRI